MHKVDCVLVRDNGVLMVEETINGLRTRLEEIAANENGNLDEIANAVEAVWNEHPAISAMQLGVCVAYAMRKLDGIPLSEHEVIEERIKQYIRNAIDLFYIARGPGKGVQLLSRLTQEELAKVADQKARAEVKKAEKAAKVA